MIRPFLGLAALITLTVPVALGGGTERDKPARWGPASITSSRLAAHVRLLASDRFEGRKAGTDGGRKAAAYLVDQFRALHLEPRGTQGFRQPFRRVGHTLENVIGLMRGADDTLREEYIVIGAHFDHLGRKGKIIFRGADDNASGCAALIEIARAMMRAPATRRSVLFIAFDGEEIGLLGSKEFLRHPTVPRHAITAMINLDMLSRGKTGDVRVAGMSRSKELREIAMSAANRAGLTLHDDHDKEWRHASDHGPFGDARIPFLYFGVLDHPDYHRSTDTFDRINTEKLTRVARLAYLSLRAAADRAGLIRYRAE